MKLAVEKDFVISAEEVQDLLTNKQGSWPKVKCCSVAQKEGQEQHKIIILNWLTVTRKKKSQQNTITPREKKKNKKTRPKTKNPEKKYIYSICFESSTIVVAITHGPDPDLSAEKECTGTALLGCENLLFQAMP